MYQVQQQHVKLAALGNFKMFQGLKHAKIVRLGIIRMKMVYLTASSAGLERLVLAVKRAHKVNGAVVVIQMPLRAMTVVLDITRMKLAKGPAFHVCPVNTTMRRAPPNASRAVKIRFPKPNIVKLPVTNAPKAGRPKKAAPNAPIAHLVNLKTPLTTKKSVPNARLDLHKVKRTQATVLDAQQDKKHPSQVAAFALCAT